MYNSEPRGWSGASAAPPTGHAAQSLVTAEQEKVGTIHYCPQSNSNSIEFGLLGPLPKDYKSLNWGYKFLFWIFVFLGAQS